MDLGTKQPENMAVPTSPSTKEGKVYPSLYIDGEVAEQFLKECDCEIGDEGEAVVRFRLTGINKRNGQSSVTLECRALMLEGEEDEPEESDGWQKREEEEGVEALKGKSSRSKNPAVSKLMEEDEDEEDEGEEED